MEKMAQINDENRDETRDIFLKLNTMIKKESKKKRRNFFDFFKGV